MTIEQLGNGYVRLTAQNGVMQKSTRTVYSEVICKSKDIRKYEAYNSNLYESV